MSFESDALVVDRKVTTHGHGGFLHNIPELRLLFASSVMISHAATLLNPEHYRLLRMVLNSEAAVQGFFILSGYLVFGSYSRLRDPGQFYKRRMLRIYPAYFVAVLFFVTLGVVQALAIGRGIGWNELPRYLAANLTTLNFVQPTLAGVFAGNSLEVINGALWSIKVELMFYALVPLLFFLGQRMSFVMLAALLILAGAAWWPVLNYLGDQWGIVPLTSLKFQLPGQVHYFGLGIALFAQSEGKLSKFGMAAVVLWAVLLLALLGDSRHAVQALVLVVVIRGVSILPRAKDWLGGRDLSYGIYLSHFPITQLVLVAGAGGLPFPLYLAVIVGFSVVYASLSWRFVEEPALAWGGRQRPKAPGVSPASETAPYAGKDA